MVPKFRAWDDARDEYFEVRSLSFPVSSNDKLGIVATTGDQTAYGPNMILEQYTGLKDANGKEIYVGDIVKYHNLDDKYQYLPIIWLDQDCLVSAGGYRIDIVARRCEVIGNIHENPELLEAQHG